MTRTSTSDFNEWFAAGNIPTTRSMIEDLLQVLQSKLLCGVYRRTQRGNLWSIHGPGSFRLVLKSDNARKALTNMVRHRLTHRDVPWVDDRNIEIEPTITLEPFLEYD